MNKIKIKPIIYGVLTDTIGTIVGGVIIVISLLVGGIPAEEISSRLDTFFWLTLGLVVGLVFTVLGGFVAGRTAKQSEVLHGGIVGGVGMLAFFIPGESLPVWYHIICFVGMVPAGMGGGYMSRCFRKKH